MIGLQLFELQVFYVLPHGVRLGFLDALQFYVFLFSFQLLLLPSVVQGLGV